MLGPKLFTRLTLGFLCLGAYSITAELMIAWTWCQSGYARLARACVARGYRLFRMRPKLHMQQHFAKPGSICFHMCMYICVCVCVPCYSFARILLQHCFREGISCLNPLSAGLMCLWDVMCDYPCILPYCTYHLLCN